MDSRRTFLKKATLLAGSAAAVHVLPPSIQRALAINAPSGSTYLDAEHIVFLMQENRSFDHCYGTLRGVRGFNDPRAIQLPNGLPVWAQTDGEGHTYTPFRLDINNTKATWMGSLPHGWRDMVHARNDGKMDTWLDAKRPRNADYRHMPLTMGYYDRADIPFYYALADAFTVCDQHFCSSLTGTSANRSYFWSGTVRETPRDPDSVAHVDNGQINYKDVRWKTYPERLQEAGIAWKVYQNELSLPVGFEGEEEDWLANFTNNNLEFHRQYHVRYHPAYRAYLEKHVQSLAAEIAGGTIADDAELADAKQQLARLQADLERYTAANFEALPKQEREIHQRAFVTNTADPHYHELETITYTDHEGEKTAQVPKGDIFHQFRSDVDSGKLPTVSWLCAPCNFSDHPTAPWFGAWYVSEALDILTKNPEVWKKTIFILNYDENDGYFDHIPPFVPPHPGKPDSGAVASGIDVGDEYVTVEQERIRTDNPDTTLASPIGLGYRVPLVIASPWSKGGWVNSEVFDLTSPLQFLEHFLAEKTGRPIQEPNISGWRRLVCGDLTSVFRPVTDTKHAPLQPVDRDAYVAHIYTSRQKALPGNYRLFDANAPQWPRQEPGTKPACAIPYALRVSAIQLGNSGQLALRFDVGKDLPKTKTIGVPFRVQALVPYRPEQTGGRTWDFAVRESEPLTYSWPVDRFDAAGYHLQVHGPNGFFREFKGSKADPAMQIEVGGDQKAGGLTITATGPENLVLHISDRSYGSQTRQLSVSPSGSSLSVNLSSSSNWYDIEVTAAAYPGFSQRFAGHVETGTPSITDPLMGGVA